jgi:hypothetical protein
MVYPAGALIYSAIYKHNIGHTLFDETVLVKALAAKARKVT